MKEWSTLKKLMFLRATGGGGSLDQLTAEGNPLSFITNVKRPLVSLACPMEPVQDLHGQSNPYPPGGGKNLFDQQNTNFFNKEITNYGANDTKAIAQVNALPAGTYTISFKAKITNLNGADPVNTRIGLYIRAADGNDILNVNGQIDVTANVGTVYSKSVTFNITDNFVGKFTNFWAYSGKNSSVSPEVTYTGIVYDVQIEKGSTASSYAPYSNICPITGWTGANVSRTGKNLLSVTAVSRTESGVTITQQEDGSIVVDGTATENIRVNNSVIVPKKLIAGKSYTLSGSIGLPVANAYV